MHKLKLFELEHDFIHTNETGCMLKYTAQNNHYYMKGVGMY